MLVHPLQHLFLENKSLNIYFANEKKDNGISEIKRNTNFTSTVI